MGSLIAEISRRRVFANLSVYLLIAWLAVQAGDVLFPGWGIPEENIRFVAYAFAALFPLMLIIGWRYDVSSQGLRVTPPAGAASAEGLALRRRDWAALGASVLLGLAVFGYSACLTVNTPPVDQSARDSFALEAARASIVPTSVAVLPFGAIGENSGYLAAGLSNEMINTLARVRGLRVTARASAGYFSSDDYRLDDVIERLQVANVVTGGVQREGERVRISIALISALSGEVLWSDVFDRGVADLLSMQTEVAVAVADALKVSILGEDLVQIEQQNLSRGEAHDLVLLAERERDFDRQLALYDRALALDPTYIDAHLRRALAFWPRISGPGSSAEDVLALMADTLATVEALDPDISEKSFLYQHLRGLRLRRLLLLGRGDAASERQVEEAFREVVALNPSYTRGYMSLAIHFRRLGRLDEAETQLREIIKRDRLYPSTYMQLSRVYSLRGEFDQAIQVALDLSDLHDGYFSLVATRYLEVHRYADAIEWLLKEDDKGNPARGNTPAESLAAAWEVLGVNAEAERWRRFMSEEVSVYNMTFGSNFEYGRAETRATLMRLQGDAPGAYRVARAGMDAAGFTTGWPALHVAGFAYDAGEFTESVALFEKAVPMIADPLRPHITRQNYQDALTLALAQLELGNEAQAYLVFGRILDVVEDMPRIGMGGSGITDVLIYAAMGDTDRAAEALGEAVAAGWLGRRLSGRRMYTVLDAVPGVEGVFQDIDAQLAVQREQANRFIGKG